MLMKFAGACFAVMLIVACSANNAATVTTSGFDCRNPNEYRFVEVENPSRKKDSEPVIPRDVPIAKFVMTDYLWSKSKA